MTVRALVFDVDGTLAETEEIHRAAFNAAFAEAGLGWSWDRALYGDLLRTTGGRERILSLDFDDAEMELGRTEPAAPGEPDEIFDREWLRALFGGAVDALRAQCEAEGRSLHFELFRRYDLEPPEPRPTYAALGREHGLSETQVLNHLAWARARFRREALARLRELSGSDDEYRQDARRLFGEA